MDDQSNVRLGTFIECKKCGREIGLDITLEKQIARIIAKAPAKDDIAFKRIDQWAQESFRVLCPECQNLPQE